MTATTTMKRKSNTGLAAQYKVAHYSTYSALTPGKEGQHQRRVQVHMAIGSGLGRRRRFRAFGATGYR
jgi:hypothetical protein